MLWYYVLLCSTLPILAVRADYYPGYYSGYNSNPYWGRPSSPPIISLTLDPQEALNSSFRVAAREDRVTDMERFLEDKAEINSSSETGETALMYGARNCSLQVVRSLLLRGADPAIRDAEGRTALIYAAQNSCADAVELLLRASPSTLYHRDKYGKKALDYATDNAALDVDGPALKTVRELKYRNKSKLDR